MIDEWVGEVKHMADPEELGAYPCPPSHFFCIIRVYFDS